MATRPRARSSRSQGSKTSDFERPPPVAQREPEPKQVFEPCAATASYFLYAQRNVIVVLHHDTLAVERKFEGHRQPVQLIVADNVSEKGGGRQIASYDTDQNAIVWDLFTGDVIARFSSYEDIKTAAWMRDGSVAFGNTQGNIILFEPSSEEHTSTRTIFDPITALAPSSDCRTFAIGYQNGSILVASLHPTFTIHHTLTTSRAPSPIVGLAWHGSSSKQKSDMLATHTSDGDLRVWSVSKAPHVEPPRIIRVIGAPEASQTSLSWFAWSKNGRILNYSENETKAWDVRTKKMTYETVPTIENVAAIANYGPNAVLFTVGRNFTVQQYDLAANEGPVMVANVQHVPPNAPPTPPDFIDEEHLPRTVPMKLMSAEPLNAPSVTYETSEDEGPILSPLEKISKEMDELEEERRDQLAPLSPISSRASMSSASSYGRPRRRRSPSNGGQSEGTLFSGASSMRSGHESMSIQSEMSGVSSPKVSSAARKSTMRGPHESDQMKTMDLFPYARARISEVKFRTPQYPKENLTADVLRTEMLSIVFGWDHDVESLIRDEQSRHRPGSAPVVLLSKWLGDSGADAMTSMVASESMTSTDWMLLALASNMGNGAQSKQMGEAFVRRSLEANEIHPAVAILLGLGSLNEAVEVYVSRKYFLEAVLLTCLIFPHDWQRQSHLVREWGTWAVGHDRADLAVRCFSCTGIETSEPWFSPKSQDMVYQAQQKALAPDPSSPPASPPSAGSSNRLTTKNASLKLITSFGDKGAPKPQETTMGFTPIMDTAVTPSTAWQRSTSRGLRDQSETRTATPRGVTRARFPSASRKSENDAASTTADGRRPRRKGTPAMSDADGPTTVIETSHPADTLPSPAPNAFKEEKFRERASSRDRNYHNLHIDMVNAVETEEAPSPQTSNSVASRGRHKRSTSGVSRNSKTSAMETPASEVDPISPAMTTGNSLKSFKGRSIDRYISSLEEANSYAQQQHSEYRMRTGSRDGRSRSRPGNREGSRPRQGSETAYIKPGKRSPTSPKSMTAEDAGKYTTNLNPEVDNQIPRPATTDSVNRRARSSSRQAVTRTREESPESKPSARSGSRAASRNASRPGNRNISTEATEASTGEAVSFRSGRHSPPSPAPMESEPVARSRQRSSSRRATESRARSSSRRPKEAAPEEMTVPLSPEAPSEGLGSAKPFGLSRKALAAKELEDRRLSLARRTPIPQPGEHSGKPALSPHSVNEGELLSAKSYQSGGYFGIQRSQTVDPDAMQRQYGVKTSGTSTTSVPIGLPATPRAMRHPRYMGSDPSEKDDIPAVPALPENLETLAPISYQPGSKEADDIGPLLPATVYDGQRPLLARSASAPPEQVASNGKYSKSGHRRDMNSSKSSHNRQASERDFGARGMETGIGQTHTIDEEEVIVVGEDTQEEPPVLAELAHLAGPPPPPPPPTMYQNSGPPPPPPSGVINIAIDGNNEGSLSSMQADDASMVPPPLSSSTRGRQNSLETSSSKGSSKWRNMAEKLRNGSRSRNSNKSPAPESQFYQQQTHYQSLSSDSILPSSSYRSGKNSPPAVPYETNVSIPQTTPQMTAGGFAPTSVDSSPSLGSNSQGYRNPKELRANMQQDAGDTKSPPPPQANAHFNSGQASETTIQGGFF